MGDSTGISWTDATWNPIRGCSRVSEGCRNCYAERVAARFSDPGMPYHGLAERRLRIVNADEHDRGNRSVPRWTGEVRMVPEHLADPLRWRKPRRIFVNSMSDLFHEKLTDEQIAAVFGVMAACPQHTFQVLTKRARRMREWFEWALDRPDTVGFLIGHARSGLLDHNSDVPRDLALPSWPLPDVWIGVSVENQEAADERIPELLRTPAAVRFLSCEPLIGNLEINRWMAVHPRWQSKDTLPHGQHPPYPLVTWHRQALVHAGWRCPLQWVIAGCESGPGARPCDVEWLRSLRNQCAAARVPYFLKQATFDCDVDGNGVHDGPGSKFKTRGARGSVSGRAGALIELPYLDGVQHAAFPEVRCAL